MSRRLPTPDTAPPENILWLVELIGVDAAQLLVEEEGGRRLYIPHTAGANGTLVSLIGAEAAAALSRARGGDTLKLPKCKAWLVRIHYAGGKSYREIAKRLGVDDASVHRMITGRDGKRIDSGQRAFAF